MDADFENLEYPRDTPTTSDAEDNEDAPNEGPLDSSSEAEHVAEVASEMDGYHSGHEGSHHSEEDGRGSSRGGAEEEDEEDELIAPPFAELSAHSDDLEVAAEDSTAILTECEKTLSATDFIMEPKVISILEKYFSCGGTPEKVVELLSGNYSGVAQQVNLFAEWLIGTGVAVETVEATVEQHLADIICRNFQSKKADLIFHQQTEEQITWLPELIAHVPWRNLVYKLSKQYPDCVMLSFILKLISDANLENEICSVPTVAQQLEIFGKVLCRAISNVVAETPESAEFEGHMSQLASCVCHSEHSYLYTQSILHQLGSDQKFGPCLKRLAQDLRQRAERLPQTSADTTALHLALYGGAGSTNPAIIQALHSMLSRNTLNPADISLLYNHYSANDPPAVDLIKDVRLLDLLIDALFRPESRLNVEHKPKYIYLLAYAASVSEMYKKGTRKYHNRDELKATQTAIEKCHLICTGKKSSHELLAELPTLFGYLRNAVVGKGVLHWVKCTMSQPGYFKVLSDPVTLQLALIDEVVNLHPLLHQSAFDLLSFLFELPLDDLEILARLELRKLVIDRMVHLLSKGLPLVVVNYVRRSWEQQDTDLSLIRYFVTETLDIIAPPYSPSFIEAFLPLVDSKDLIGGKESLSEDRQTAVREFLTHAK